MAPPGEMLEVPGMSLPVANPFALQPAPPDADADRLAALETQLSVREGELDTLKIELQQLQTRYLSDIGALYAELAMIDAEVEAAEIRAGLRPPPEESDTGAAAHVEDVDDDDVSCGGQAAPSDMLKRAFRDLARTIHPDLAQDDAARFRRHSLMAEANRAYAERDHDRLLLILRKWELSAEAVTGDDPDSARLRVARKTAQIEERLVAIDGEFIELRNSAIARLKLKIDDTRRQGWDLFAEMVLQARADITRARARLVAAQRMVGIRGERGS
jgi:hypothetical protein